MAGWLAQVALLLLCCISPWKARQNRGKAKEAQKKTRSRNACYHRQQRLTQIPAPASSAAPSTALPTSPHIIICSSHIAAAAEAESVVVPAAPPPDRRSRGEGGGRRSAAAQSTYSVGAMSRPAGSGGRATAILFGVLVLMSLVVLAEKTSPPAAGGAAIGGRRMLLAGDGDEMRRTLEDFRADDPFQDSERKVPNGPDPIHNKGAGKSGRSPGRE